MGTGAAFKYGAAAHAAYSVAVGHDGQAPRRRRGDAAALDQQSRAECASSPVADEREVEAPKAVGEHIDEATEPMQPPPPKLRSRRSSAPANSGKANDDEVEDNPEKETILNMYSVEDFEFTAYAALPGARAGTRIYLQEFEMRPVLNGLTGVCKDTDSDLNVWVVKMDDGRWMRVLPKMCMPVETKTYRPPAPLKGHILWGSSQSEAYVERDFPKEKRAPSKKSSASGPGGAKRTPSKQRVSLDAAASLQKAEEDGAVPTSLHNMFNGGTQGRKNARQVLLAAMKAEVNRSRENADDASAGAGGQGVDVSTAATALPLEFNDDPSLSGKAVVVRAHGEAVVRRNVARRPSLARRATIAQLSTQQASDENPTSDAGAASSSAVPELPLRRMKRRETV